MLVESVNSIKQVVNTGQNHDVAIQGQASNKSAKAQRHEGRKADISLLKDVLEVSKNHFDVAGVVLDFSVHEATGTVKVDVTDKETGEVIREVPPQKVLDLMARLDEMMGIICDEKA